MENYIVNLINIKVKENIVEIEGICKYKKEENILIITDSMDVLQEKYEEIDFSKEYNIIKISLTIRDIKNNIIKFKVKKNNELYNTIILDNKNNEVVLNGNSYTIFLKKFKIILSKDKIEIKKKKVYDRLLYELKKQIYAVKKHYKFALIRLISRKNKKYYLFNDRIMYGDDNAEQLFKYINRVDKKMSKNCYFILDRCSPRYKLIRKYGKVIKFGSLQHKIKYINSRMILSSHASYFDRVYNPFNEQEMHLVKDLITKKFVFLQHGVTFNDVHEILNRSQIIADLFITSTHAEYDEIKSTRYMYHSDMVVCTGMSRFDKLENKKDNVILIAPTWRAYLTDVKYRQNNERQEFKKSMFYIEYKKILEDKQLINKLKEYNFKIKFLLHPAFIQFKKEFEEYKNESVEVLTTEEATYSELFKECAIFVTDYSSTHFDLAYMKKPIIYYQFDLEKFYEAHYNKGYFEYEKDSFGDVVYTKENLMNELINYLENNCNIKEKYKKRIEETFNYIDNDNSKRIYEKIKDIDKKNEYNYRFNNVH